MYQILIFPIDIDFVPHYRELLRRRFYEGWGAGTKFARPLLHYLFKRRALYHLKAWEFRNSRAFEFFNY